MPKRLGEDLARSWERVREAQEALSVALDRHANELNRADYIADVLVSLDEMRSRAELAGQPPAPAPETEARDVQCFHCGAYLGSTALVVEDSCPSCGKLQPHADRPGPDWKAIP